MRIAVVQAAGTPGDVDANLRDVRRLAAEAAGEGARLAVFPEAFVSGYNIGGDRVAALAQPCDGEAVAEIAAVAGEHGLAILCGYYERAGADVFNSAVLVDRAGRVAANARKTHLWGDVDKLAVGAGQGFTAAAVEGVGVGILICYDIEFPEAARALALAGAQLIAVPTALMAPSTLIADVLVPARAYENQVFVAYANRVGREGDLDYIGRSCVAGPEGVVARAGAEEAVLVADLDLDAITRSRRRHSYLEERRPSLYRGR